MKKRILSAIVMLAIVIPVVYFGGDLFRLGVGIVSILALKEILDLKKSHHSLPLFVQLVAIVALLFIVLAEFDGYSILFGVTYRGIAILLLSSMLFLAYSVPIKPSTKYKKCILSSSSSNSR